MKKYSQQLIVALLMAAVLIPSLANAQTWTSNGVHSTVMYTVKHMVTPMIGVFKKFDVTIQFDATKPLETSIEANLDASSVMMGMDKLEGHLKSADFFDVANNPTWKFKSTGITAAKKSKTKFIAAGELTVRGVTKTVSIPFEFLGTKESSYGAKAGFSADFAINRLDYGVGQGDWAGTGVVANEVKITVYLEMDPKK